MEAPSFRRLCIAILLVLPFTKSLTVPAGFALKLYEPLIMVALAAAFAEGGIWLAGGARTIRLWWVFFVLSLFPTVLGYQLVLESNLAALEWATGRYAPTVNMIFHTVYLALDIVALTVFVTCLARGVLTVREFVRWWTWGAVISVGYAVFLNFVYLAGLPLAVALRFTDVQTAAVAGVEFVRSGPFEEGNFFGLYLLASMAMALWASSRQASPFLVRAIPILALGIFISSSPAAMGLMLVLLVASSFDSRVPGWVRMLEGSVAVLVVGVVLATDLLDELVLNKFSLLLYGGVTDSGNVSLVRRVNEMVHCWRLFLDHPLGVGIGNFGYFWGNHPEYYPWLTVAYTTKKQIPNNVYLEVLTEQGIQGLLVFVAIFGDLALRLRQRRESFLLLSLLAMAAYFVVFPTFRLVFLWVFWAFLLHAAAGPVTRDA